MAKQIVSLRLPKHILEGADRLANRNAITRTELITHLIERAIRQEEAFYNIRRMNLLAGDKP